MDNQENEFSAEAGVFDNVIGDPVGLPSGNDDEGDITLEVSGESSDSDIASSSSDLHNTKGISYSKVPYQHRWLELDTPFICN